MNMKTIEIIYDDLVNVSNRHDTHESLITISPQDHQREDRGKYRHYISEEMRLKDLIEG